MKIDFFNDELQKLFVWSSYEATHLSAVDCVSHALQIACLVFETSIVPNFSAYPFTVKALPNTAI